MTVITPSYEENDGQMSLLDMPLELSSLFSIVQEKHRTETQYVAMPSDWDSRIYDLLYDAVDDEFYIEDDWEVKAFLLQNTELFPFLLTEVPVALQEYFPDAKYWSLELEDLDLDGTSHLFVTVYFSDPSVNLFTRLKHFDKEWWMNCSSDFNSLLNFDAEVDEHV